MDTLSRAERGERMSRVKNKDSKAEMIVRRLLHSLGYGYRLHVGGLPGKPDIVFPGRKRIIFVHGCFWHRHEGCPNNRLPKSRLDFWLPKLEGNRERDIEILAVLREKGWDVLTVWECEVKDIQRLTSKLGEFLDD